MAGRIDAVIRGAGVVVVAGVLAGGGAYVINEVGGGDPGEAQAFVNEIVTGDTCTRSNTPVTFAEAEAANHLCGSLQAAWDVAAAGDLVIVQGGSYSPSEMSISSTATRNPVVTFNAEADATISVTGTGEIEFKSMRGLVVDFTDGAGGKGLDVTSAQLNASQMSIGYGGSQQTQNVTVKGFKLHDNSHSVNMGTILAWAYCDNVTISDFEMYNVWGADGMQSLSDNQTHAHACNNVTIDRAYLHDFGCTTNAGDHQDAYQGFAGSNITIQNTRIIGMDCGIGGNDGSQGWFPNPNALSDTGATGQNFINNVVADIQGGVTINVGEVDNPVIKNNTLSGSINGDCSGPCGSGIVFKNNIVNTTSCTIIGNFYSGRATNGYGHNVLGSACGHGAEGDVQWSNFNNMFVNAATSDYHLVTGSFAVDKGDTADYPATDLDGVTRFLGSAPDAGAYEKE